MAIRLWWCDTRTQSGCRLPHCSAVAREVEQSVKPVSNIRVSSNIVHSDPKVEFKNDVITVRTLLWAEVRASLNLGKQKRNASGTQGFHRYSEGRLGMELSRCA